MISSSRLSPVEDPGVNRLIFRLVPEQVACLPFVITKGRKEPDVKQIQILNFWTILCLLDFLLPFRAHTVYKALRQSSRAFSITLDCCDCTGVSRCVHIFADWESFPLMLWNQNPKSIHKWEHILHIAFTCMAVGGNHDAKIQQNDNHEI